MVEVEKLLQLFNPDRLGMKSSRRIFDVPIVYLFDRGQILLYDLFKFYFHSLVIKVIGKK